MSIHIHIGFFLEPPVTLLQSRQVPEVLLREILPPRATPKGSPRSGSFCAQAHSMWSAAQIAHPEGQAQSSLFRCFGQDDPSATSTVVIMFQSNPGVWSGELWGECRVALGTHMEWSAFTCQCPSASWAWG